MEKLDDIYVFENYFSPERLNWFANEMERLRHDPKAIRDRTSEKMKKNQLMIIRPGTSLRDDLENLFSEMFPFQKSTYRFYSTNFYEIRVPYVLHCDNLGEQKGFYQVVVPLDVSPADGQVAGDTYTIIFDQTADINSEWIAPVYRVPEGYKPFHNKPIYDPSYFGGWTNEYKISEEDGLKYWGPEWGRLYREAYKGFSIKHAFKWRMGDVLVFNSKYVHCAAEMGFKGIEKKSGLLVCLEKPV